MSIYVYEANVFLFILECQVFACVCLSLYLCVSLWFCLYSVRLLGVPRPGTVLFTYCLAGSVVYCLRCLSDRVSGSVAQQDKSEGLDSACQGRNTLHLDLVLKQYNKLLTGMLELFMQELKDRCQGKSWPVFSDLWPYAQGWTGPSHLVWPHRCTATAYKQGNGALCWWRLRWTTNADTAVIKQDLAALNKLQQHHQWTKGVKLRPNLFQRYRQYCVF